MNESLFDMTAQEVIDYLRELSDTTHHVGMKRFGIDNTKALGVKVPELRELAREIKINQQLSLDLWETDIHEARLLASMIGDPKQVTEKQFDDWTNQFNSWDVCDQVCGNLFDRTPFVIDKINEYTRSEQEFVKRAGFVLMAEYAMHNKKACNELFLPFFPIMEREAWDDRNFVKKAINWALRQIGKRNRILQAEAIDTAKRIAGQNTKAAKWIAADALRELENRVLKK